MCSLINAKVRPFHEFNAGIFRHSFNKVESFRDFLIYILISRIEWKMMNYLAQRVWNWRIPRCNSFRVSYIISFKHFFKWKWAHCHSIFFMDINKLLVKTGFSTSYKLYNYIHITTLCCNYLRHLIAITSKLFRAQAPAILQTAMLRTLPP